MKEKRAFSVLGYWESRSFWNVLSDTGLMMIIIINVID